MTARAMWKGVLVAGDERVPVKLYSAVESGAGVHFRLLHEPDRVPLRQRMVNPVTGDVVEHGEALRARELEDGRLVILDDEDLEALDPGPSRDVQLLRFVPAGSIAPGWYDRPYFLGPDGDDGPYAAMAEALAAEEREAVARWAMRNKRYVGALRARDHRLVLVTLRRAGEVMTAAGLDAPGGRDLDESELDMAERLVDALAGPFEPEAFRDEYRDRVLELVEAKASGKAVRIEEYRERSPTSDESLAGALQASLAEARSRKSA